MKGILKKWQIKKQELYIKRETQFFSYINYNYVNTDTTFIYVSHWLHRHCKNANRAVNIQQIVNNHSTSIIYIIAFVIWLDIIVKAYYIQLQKDTYLK
jgi:hypothetical protein